MRNYFKILTTIFLVIVFTSYSCGHVGAGKGKEEKEKGKEETVKNIKDEVMLSFKQCDAIGIQFGDLQKKYLKDVVHANGYLVVPPQGKAEVSVYYGGVVKSIEVSEGNRVNRGQSLAILEHPDYIQLQQDYLSARNNFSLAEKEYYRQKELFSANTTAEKNLQKAESDYNSVKIEIASLSGKLKLMGIDVSKLDYNTISSGVIVKSPIDGYITAIHATIGKFIDPNSVMFEVVDISRLNLVLQVFGDDISKIKPGQHLSFALPAETERHGEGTVYAIDKTFDDVKKSFSVRVKVNVNGNQQALLPGIYVNAIIETTNNSVNVMPDEAIIKEDQSEHVFILSQTKTIENERFNLFKIVEVKTGLSLEGFTSITFIDDVPENAQFVVKGAYYVQSEKNKSEGQDSN